MKKISTSAFVLTMTLLIFTFENASSQQLTKLILHPNGSKGKDALLTSLEPDTNYGDHGDLLMTAWTNGGIPLTSRSLLEFDLSSIPANAIIIKAQLSLYWNDDATNIGHSTIDGPNACWVRRVTTPWEEHTVTWNTEPSTTTLHQVTIPTSTSSTENFPNINVTALVQDMVATGNYGFEIRLKIESYYRSMLFASSDDADGFRRPKLVVSYSPSPKISQEQDAAGAYLIYPVLTSNNVNISFTKQDPSMVTIQLFNLAGMLELQKKVSTESGSCNLNMESLESGVYILTILDSNGIRVRTQKIVKQ